MASLYLWGRSIQEMSGDVVIGRSIYGVVVIDGSLYSRFYGSHTIVAIKYFAKTTIYFGNAWHTPLKFKPQMSQM